MSTMTEYFAAHIVPRLTIGNPDNAPDGYAQGLELSVTVDGYAMDLRLNTVYELQTRTQALYYGMLHDDDIAKMTTGDDAEKLSLLNNATVINGHYLAAGSVRNIATTRKCSVLVMKAAASTATVNLDPLGSIFDDLGGR